jgi:hypothetical protein
MTSPKFLFGLALCLGLTLTVAACGDDDDTGTTGDTDSPGADTSGSASCENDTDCDLGQRCYQDITGAGRCIPISTGDDDDATDTTGGTGDETDGAGTDTDDTGLDGDTTTGEVINCQSIADCPPEFICSVGECVPPGECSVRTQAVSCPPALPYCDPTTKTCGETKKYDCFTDSECTNDIIGRVCDRDNLKCVQCLQLADCPKGKTCNEFNACETFFSCETSGCQGTQVCNADSGFCVPPGCIGDQTACTGQTPRCRDDGICVQCVVDGDCASLGSGASCRNNQCVAAAGLGCNLCDPATEVCQNNVCKRVNGGGAGAACQFDIDCKADFTCVLNLSQCQKECFTNSDCGTGEICVQSAAGASLFCAPRNGGDICGIFPIPGLCK